MVRPFLLSLAITLLAVVPGQCGQKIHKFEGEGEEKTAIIVMDIYRDYVLEYESFGKGDRHSLSIFLEPVRPIHRSSLLVNEEDKRGRIKGTTQMFRVLSGRYYLQVDGVQWKLRLIESGNARR